MEWTKSQQAVFKGDKRLNFWEGRALEPLEFRA